MSKREALITTTKDLLWAVGFESMSPKLILKHSGAGQGSLYHHFTGKEALALAALEEVEQEMLRRAESVLLGPEPPLARVFSFLNLKRSGIRGCRIGRLTAETSVIQSSLKEPIQRYFQHLSNILEGVLLQARERGEIPQDTGINELVHLIIAAVQGGFVLSRASQSDAAMDAALKGVKDYLTLLQHHAKT